MLKFSPNEVPYQYDFEDPDTGYYFRYADKTKLINHIIKYREQNRLEPIKHLNLVLEDYWCRKPVNTPKCVPLSLARGWIATFRGAIQVLENIFYGEDKMVSQEVADKRSAVCVQCPHNIFPDRGPFIKWSDEIAEASTGGRRSEHHDSLGNCGVCTCPLRAKVFAKDVKPTEKERDQFPSFCWQLTEDGV
jgi:hypothetical protein